MFADNNHRTGKQMNQSFKYLADSIVCSCLLLKKKKKRQSKFVQRKNGSYSMNQLTQYTNFMSFLPSEDCVQEKQITNTDPCAKEIEITS